MLLKIFLTPYNRKIFPILLFSILLSLKVQSQDMDRVKRNIDTLTSPSMDGRGYVNQGDKKAANYIQSQYKNTGLNPFKQDYLQPFNLKINTFPNKLFLKTDKTTLLAGNDYLINPISKSGKGSGKVFIVDSLLLNNTERQNEFLSSSFKKGIVVYSYKNYPQLIELPNKFFDKIHEAKALIELQETKLTHGLSSSQLSKPIFEIKKSDFNLQTEKIKFRVDAILVEEYPTQNVIGYVEGKYQPDSFLVVTAHYDHLGRMGKNTYFPGANDNAAGIAMLLELADYYAKSENQPDYSIVFMAFAAEEAGLLGSKYYVQNPLFPLPRIKFLVNLDLVGTGDDGMMVVNGAVFKTDFEMLLKINQDKKYLASIQKRGIAANSDHYYFSENGVKSFFFYTLGGIKAYHDIYDKAETLPLTKFKEVFNLIKDFFSTFNQPE